MRQNLVEELARHLYLRPREIEEHGRQMRRGAAPARTVKRAPVPPGERELARILLDCSCDWRSKIFELVDFDYIEDSRVRRLLQDARAVDAPDDKDVDFVGDLLRECSDPEVTTLVAELCNLPMPEVTDESIRTQLSALLQRQARERARRLAPLIAAAEQRGDAVELDRLLAEKARLRQESTKI